MDADLLDRVRKLLAKAEDEGCSPAEAEALTAKAAELMARYGIDRALLGALRPETDRPADRVFTLDNPWGDVKRHLLAGLATGAALPVRADAVGGGHAAARLRLHAPTWSGPTSCSPRCSCRWRGHSPRRSVPGSGGEARAWRRSWMLGYCHGRGDAGPRRRGGGGRVGVRWRGRDRGRRPGSRRRWSSPTGRWSCGGRSRRPTRGCGRHASPTRAAATATGTARARRPTSAARTLSNINRYQGSQWPTINPRKPR